MRTLISSPVVRNIAAVASGTVIAQGVVLSFSPIITRIYSPETFGVQGIFLALISVLSPVVALRYPMAIVVAKDDEEARRIGHLAILIAFGMSVLLSLALFANGNSLMRLFGAEALGSLIWLLPVALFFVALQDVAEYRAARLGVFRVVAITTVLQAVLTNLARVVGGIIAPIAATLVAVTTIAPFVHSVLLKVAMSKKITSSTLSSSWAESTRLLIEYCDFPRFRAPTDLLGAMAQTSPVFLLSTLFSPKEAGLYVLARSVVNLPMNIVGSAVGNVYYSRLADLHRDRRSLFSFTVKATVMQFLIPGSMTLAVALFFPDLFSLIFGEPWRPAGEFAQWMSLWIVCMVGNIPSVRALPVIGLQKMHLMFNVMLMIGGALSILMANLIWGSAYEAVACFSIVTVVIYISQILTYLWRIRAFDIRMGFHG